MIQPVRKILESYVDAQKLMQVSTLSPDCGVRTCSVWYAMDDDLNLYFFSSTLRSHSADLESDSRVSGTIVKQQSPDVDPQGFQFYGTCELLEDDVYARSIYADRVFSDEKIQDQIDNNNHRFYKVTVSKYKLLDPANFPGAAYQELDL